MKKFLIIYLLSFIFANELFAEMAGQCMHDHTLIQYRDIDDLNIQLNQLNTRYCESLNTNPCEPVVIKQCQSRLKNKKINFEKIFSILKSKSNFNEIALFKFNLISDQFKKCPKYNQDKKLAISASFYENIKNEIKMDILNIKKDKKVTESFDQSNNIENLFNFLESIEMEGVDVINKQTLIEGFNKLSNSDAANITKIVKIFPNAFKIKNNKYELKENYKELKTDDLVSSLIAENSKVECTLESLEEKFYSIALSNENTFSINNDKLNCSIVNENTVLSFEEKLKVCSELRCDEKFSSTENYDQALFNKPIIAIANSMIPQPSSMFAAAQNASAHESSENKGSTNAIKDSPTINPPAQRVVERKSSSPSIEGSISRSASDFFLPSMNTQLRTFDYDSFMGRLDTISSNLTSASFGQSSTNPSSTDDYTRMIDEIKDLKGKISSGKVASSDKKKSNQAKSSKELSSEELEAALKKIEELESKLAGPSTELRDIKKTVAELKKSAADYKADSERRERELRDLQSENELLKQRNLEQRRMIESSAKVATQTVESLPTTKASATRSIASVPEVVAPIVSNGVVASSISSTKGPTVSSGLSLSISPIRVGEVQGSQDQLIIAAAEFKSYPYKLPENASEIEITNLLLKSKGNAILVGDSEQIIPEIKNGLIVIDESGKPKYKVKKVKIKIVDINPTSYADLRMLDGKALKAVKLSDLNQLLRSIK